MTGGLILGLVLYLRSGGGETPLAPEARRGGQVVGSIRGEPRTFNRLVDRNQTSDLISMLQHARLVRVNRETFELEPWLAERWEASADGRTYTVHLRQGVMWSDGAPFTSADVLFSVRAVYDPKVESVMAGPLTVAGQPIRATAPDANTVVLQFAAPSGAGMRLLDSLVILPKHKLEARLAAGTLAQAWDTKTPPSEIVGLGPFMLREYQPGQRLIYERNPRYWRTAPDGAPLPYLDRVVLEIVPDQNAELLRLQAGEIDFTQSELRSEDYVPARRSEDAGRLRVIELGVGPDADALWFCQKTQWRIPGYGTNDPRFEWVQRPEFRQAISHAVNREAFAETVYLGAAVPIWGPITPGNSTWFWPDLPRYPHNDDRARELLRGMGLTDGDGNGVVDNGKGAQARFTVITQQGIGTYDRGLAVLKEELAGVGIVIDVAPLEFGAMIQRMLSCDYEAIYMRPLFTDLDPAANLDFWLSSGDAHFWNIGQTSPATEWERRIDTIMLEQAASVDQERRRALFRDAQRILAENLPVIYFAAPRLYYAHSTRVTGIRPSVLRPPALWNADSLSVAN